MDNVAQIILGSSIGTSILTGIIAYFFHKKTERFNAEVKNEFEILSRIQNTDLEWKKQSAKLLGQVYIHLNRTRLAFANYHKLRNYDEFFENEIMYHSNKHIRDSILENGHYIPPEILEEASKLVEHYDVWLVKYHRLRKELNDKTTVHVYVGPDGVPYPQDAEEKIKAEYIKLFKQIMTNNPSPAPA